MHRPLFAPRGVPKLSCASAVKARLAIAITADPELPVPPLLYGGIERVIDMLVRGLVDRGHHVVLFAHPGSNANCELIPYPGASSLSRRDTLRNLWAVSRTVVKGRFDVVHSFGRIAYLLPLLPLPIPKLMTGQREVTPRSVTPRSVRWEPAG